MSGHQHGSIYTVTGACRETRYSDHTPAVVQYTNTRVTKVGSVFTRGWLIDHSAKCIRRLQDSSFWLKSEKKSNWFDPVRAGISERGRLECRGASRVPFLPVTAQKALRTRRHGRKADPGESMSVGGGTEKKKSLPVHPRVGAIVTKHRRCCRKYELQQTRDACIEL